MNQTSTDPNASQLLTILQRFPAFPQIKTWWLAYSGGLDSRVLLHLLMPLNLPLRVVYVDHGLQTASAQWAQQGEQTCKALNVPFLVLQVNAQAQPGESPEAAARHARYQALASLLEPDQVLLTAQHADDQAETLLLQLLRGAGSAGLSAMPFVQVFDKGWLLRPLLTFSRQAILQVAQENNLQWVEDPSNLDQRFDRNYLRHNIMPVLNARWPGVLQTLGRAASQQAENQYLLEVLAVQDLGLTPWQQPLPVDHLLLLDEPRQRNALRYWFGKHQIRMPSHAIMQQILVQLLRGRDDAEACVYWDDVELHRYRRRLYLQPRVQHDAGMILDWNGKQPIIIASLQQKLAIQSAQENALDTDLLQHGLQIRFRRGGEKIKPAGDRHTRSLKNLLQAWEIPPWQRDRVPLLYSDDELIAVCGYCVSQNHLAKTGSGFLPVILPTTDINVAEP